MEPFAGSAFPVETTALQAQSEGAGQRMPLKRVAELKIFT
jgi:hypothetical protein